MRYALHGQYIQGLHLLSHYLPHYHDTVWAQSTSLSTKATSLLEKHLLFEFISLIQNMPNTTKNITFTVLVRKIANKSYNNLEALKYYTENCFRKQINPGQNVIVLPFCMYVKSLLLHAYLPSEKSVGSWFLGPSSDPAPVKMTVGHQTSQSLKKKAEETELLSTSFQEHVILGKPLFLKQ